MFKEATRSVCDLVTHSHNELESPTGCHHKNSKKLENERVEMAALMLMPRVCCANGHTYCIRLHLLV